VLHSESETGGIVADAVKAAARQGFRLERGLAIPESIAAGAEVLE
jgi:hypothetical protein